MKTITLKIIGPTTLHGHKPGDVFEVPVDADGVPTDLLWRRRLADEKKFNVGVVSVVTGSEPASVTTPDTEH